MEDLRCEGRKKEKRHELMAKEESPTTIYHPRHYEEESDKHLSIQLMCSTLSCARIANASSLESG
jgi:hypothetical protein